MPEIIDNQTKSLRSNLWAKSKEAWHNRWDPEAGSELSDIKTFSSREVKIARILVVTGLAVSSAATLYAVAEASQVDRMINNDPNQLIIESPGITPQPLPNR
jgi:hypothetical protein